MKELIFKKETLLYDISNLAYVVGDLRGDSLSAHRLHQTFDICEEGNVDRVDRLLALAFSEVGMALRKVAIEPPAMDRLSNSDAPPEEFRLRLRRCAGGESWRIRLKEAVNEFMTARVLAGWLRVTLPEAADFWKEQADSMLESLKSLSCAAFTGHRRVPPIA